MDWLLQVLSIPQIEWLVSTLQERWVELTAGVSSFGTGLYLHAAMTKSRLRRRLAYELVEVQRAINDRVIHRQWAEDVPRKEWMLEPFVRRLDHVKGHAAQEGLGARLEYSMHGYVRAVSDLIAAWADDHGRAGSFQQAYDKSVEALEVALETLHHRRRYKPQIADLMRQRSENGDAQPGSGGTRTAFDALDARPADV